MSATAGIKQSRIMRAEVVQAVPITFGLVLVTFIDRATATATGLVQPWVQGEFALSADETPIIQFSYYGALYLSILLGPWLLLRFGRPRYLFWSIGVFAIGSLLCSLSSSLTELTAFRVLQGIGEGGFFLGGFATIFTNVPMRIVPLVVLAYGAISQCGSALAPFIAGAIVDDHSWRLLYVVLATGALIAATVIRPTLIETDAEKQRPREKRFDFIGVTLLAVSVSAYCYLAAYGEMRDWLNNESIAAAGALLVIAAVAFALWERFGAYAPIVPIDLFRRRNVMLGTALALAAGFPLFGISLHLKYMQELLNFPLATAGALIALRAVALLVSAPLGSVLAFKGVDTRLIIACGFAFTMLALLWEAAGTTSNSDYHTFVGPELVVGAGFGLTYGPLLVTVLSKLSFAQVPYAIAGMNLSFIAAGSFANAWLVTIFDHRYAQQLADLAGTVTMSRPAILAAVHSSGTVAVRRVAVLVTQQSAALAFAETALYAAGVAALAFVFSMLLHPAQPMTQAPSDARRA